MKAEYTMSNKELQDAINQTNIMVKSSITHTDITDSLNNHLKSLLDIQKVRAGYVKMVTEYIQPDKD